MKNIVLFTILFIPLINLWGQEDSLKQYFSTGIFHFKSKDFTQCIEDFSKAAQFTADPKIQQTARIYQGLSSLELSNYSDAISFFTRAIQLDSTDLASFADRGKSYFLMDNYSQAKEDFSYILQHISAGAAAERANYYLGEIADLEGKPEEAIPYFSALIDLAPDSPKAYFSRALAYEQLFAFPDAMADYDKTLELKPDHRQALVNRGVMKINMLPTAQKVSPDFEQTREACIDLLMAKQLGDSSVDDLLFLYCSPKKKSFQKSMDKSVKKIILTAKGKE